MNPTRLPNWIVVALALAALTAVCRWMDVRKLTGGVKGDEATYVSMAFSLAFDGDLKYRPEDLARFRTAYGSGPEGIFLKRGYRNEWHTQLAWPPIVRVKIPIPTDQSLEYGKPFAYSVLAAPFVQKLGLGGMLELNVLLLALSALCAVTFCRARLGRIGGTIFGLAFIGASIVPVYGAWFTPEIFNFTLVLVAYFLWAYKKVAQPNHLRRWQVLGLNAIAALLLGVATFSKPSNALLVAPILFDVLRRRRWATAAFLASVFAAGSIGLFLVNDRITGNWNYQGGSAQDRKYFVTHFPFDPDGTTFDASGSPMATDQANDQNILSPGYLLPHLRDNAVYFLAGRDAGLLPYFFPGVVVCFLWLLRWRAITTWQVTTCLACIASILGLLILAPETWNGGGGAIGNRYFLAIYPTMLFLLPAGVSLVPGIVTVLVGLTLVGPILEHPFSSSHTVWLNPARWPLRLFPVELSIMEQLPVRLTLERSRVEVSTDPEVFLYYMDSNTHFQEPQNCGHPGFPRCGFWVAPGTADIVIRTERALTVLTIDISSTIANEADVSIDGRSAHVSLAAGQKSTIQLRPDPGVYAYSSYQIVLRIKTKNGFYPRQFDPASGDTRSLGVFLSPAYEVAPDRSAPKPAEPK